MKTIISALALTAASLVHAGDFSLIASHSTSPIHLQEINANGEALWIGKTTASYCPDTEGTVCPKGDVTTFAGGDDSLSMAVVVPGGQQVYIDGDTGAVKYTQAHSANMGDNPIVTGWSLEQLSQFGELSWTNGVLFCPASGSDSSVGPWQMFAAVPGITFSSACLGAGLIASNSSTAGAWQYT